MAMATDRTAFPCVPAAAAFLLWPALWNGYTIVFADTGTYLSQAINHYAGWDRPVFYSLFMLPLHRAVTTWPVVVAQALLTAWISRLVCRVLMPRLPARGFITGMAVLSAATWLPWMVCELMPDIFTPLLVLVLCILAVVPERVSKWERRVLVALATFMIASQQSSLLLACGLIGVLAFTVAFQPGGPVGSRRLIVSWPDRFIAPRRWRLIVSGAGPKVVDGRAKPGHDTMAVTAAGAGAAGVGRGFPMALHCGDTPSAGATRRRGSLLILPPALAVLALCTVNFAAHGRFAISPFGNIFLLARVIYDGPGMAVLRRDCPAAGWRLCPYLDRFPPTSDGFLWTASSPLNLAGGPKAVSQDASAIITAAIAADPVGIARAALANTLEQVIRFGSGDGLEPWPNQVTPWIERDFPPAEQARYASASQQRGLLTMPPVLAVLHRLTSLTGIAACVLLLPMALRRRACCFGFIIAVLIALPLSAAITGSLSTPHDRYQSRIMWLPPFIATVSLFSLRTSRRV